MNPRPPEHDPNRTTARPTRPVDATGTYAGPDATRPGADADRSGTAPDARLGRFNLRGVLGKGGMGAVYRAHDPQLGREVALKVLLPDLTTDPKAKVRFLREARAQAQVSHDHIIPIHDVGEADGVAYLVMPLLKGQTLSATLNQDARPPLAEVVRIGREVADGLAAAHEAGLIHRDIKPANIWLEGAKRRVKILDFGLARTAKEADPEPASQPAPALEATLTVAGAVMGTPAYMSPEQARGKPVDHRSDIFSLGVVLYQMATGEKPFHGVIRPALLAAIATEEPLPVAALAPEVPPALSDLIARMMAKSPADRPQTCDEVAAALDEIARELAPRPVVVRPLGDVPSSASVWQELEPTEAEPDERPRRRARERPEPGENERPRQKRWLLTAAGVAAVVLAGLAALALQPARPKDKPLPPGDAKAAEKPKDKDRAPPAGETVKTPPAEAPGGDGARADAPRKGLRFRTPDRFADNKERIAPQVRVDDFELTMHDAPFTLEGFVTADAARPDDLAYRACFGFWNLASVGWTEKDREQRWFGLVYHRQLPNPWVRAEVLRPDAVVGRRTHLALVVQPDEAQLFVNGRSAGATPLKPDAPLFKQQQQEGFQRVFTLGQTFSGVLEEVRVSKGVRYTGRFEPAQRHEPDGDTLALYHLDATTGETIFDSSAHQRHGKITNPAWAAWVVPPKP